MKKNKSQGGKVKTRKGKHRQLPTHPLGHDGNEEGGPGHPHLPLTQREQMAEVCVCCVPLQSLCRRRKALREVVRLKVRQESAGRESTPSTATEGPTLCQRTRQAPSVTIHGHFTTAPPKQFSLFPSHRRGSESSETLGNFPEATQLKAAGQEFKPSSF